MDAEKRGPWFDETPKPLDCYDEPGPVGFPPVPDVPFSLDDPHRWTLPETRPARLEPGDYWGPGW